MSRGLSAQQMLILQLGYAFNCEIHGGTYRPHALQVAGDRNRPECAQWLYSESNAPPDVVFRMLWFILRGIPLNDRNSRALKCAKASFSRALSSLCDRKLLGTHGWFHKVWYEYGVVHGKRCRLWEAFVLYGYALTPEAVARLQDAEPVTFPPMLPVFNEYFRLIRWSSIPAAMEAYRSGNPTVSNEDLERYLNLSVTAGCNTHDGNTYDDDPLRGLDLDATIKRLDQVLAGLGEKPDETLTP